MGVSLTVCCVSRGKSEAGVESDDRDKMRQDETRQDGIQDVLLQRRAQKQNPYGAQMNKA